MEETQPSAGLAGLVIEAVEWLPSGSRSGLVRVRGHWSGGITDTHGLPVLLVDDGTTVHRFASLPDPRADRLRSGWRGAYVVDADLFEHARSLAVEFDGSRVAGLPDPDSSAFSEPVEDTSEGGGDVIDRAVLAERRARRAEASLEAQGQIAREALRAVEILEDRAAALETQLAEIARERDTLADQAAALTPPREVAALRERLETQAEIARGLELELARLQEPTADASAEDSGERAEPLREALTAAMATVAELQGSLREAHLARRTNDVERTANAVRLVVTEAERASLARELEKALGELERAQAGTAEARRLAAGAEAAHDETRRRFTERVAQLAAAREQVRRLETEMRSVREEVRREAQAHLAAREAELAGQAARVDEEFRVREAALQDRLIALHAEMEAKLGEMEARLERERAAREAAEQALLARLADAEQALARAQTERALAEARADAADAQRRTASVAGAARVEELEARLDALRAPGAATQPAQASTEPEPLAPELERSPGRPLRLVAAPPVVPAELLATSDPLTPARAAVVADLERASQALRERTEEPEPEAKPAGPTIVSARTDLPRHVATGSQRREYPPLRGALVKLAHDDPAAAASLIVGLASAQWRCLKRPLDYDLTIGDGPTHWIKVTAGGATVTPIDFPREWGEDYFHMEADAVTVAEMLAGVRRFRRFGGPPVSGSRKAARALNAIGRSELSLADVLRDGAELDPVLALRCLEYAIPLAWTGGHAFTVEERITGDGPDEVVYVTARDGRGVTVSKQAPGSVDATISITRTAFAAMLRGGAAPAGERPVVRGDHDAVDALREWASRVRAGAF